MGISHLFPEYGDFISLSLNVGEVLYNNMKPGIAVHDQYVESWQFINAGNDGYITGTTSQKKGLFGYTTNTSYMIQGPASRKYEGSYYQRGDYTMLNIQ